MAERVRKLHRTATTIETKDSGTGIDFDDLPQNDEDGQRDKRQPDGAQKIPLIPADRADDKGEQDGKSRRTSRRCSSSCR